jgi:hypothetical protein
MKYLNQFYLLMKYLYKALLSLSMRLRNCIFYVFSIKKINHIYIPNFIIKNTIYINPNNIKYINSIPIKFNKSTKFITTNEWDDKKEEIHSFDKKHHTYTTCKQLFVEKLNFTDTDEYNFFIKQISAGGFKGCDTKNKVDKYFINLIDLFSNIKKNGYKNRRKFNEINNDNEIEFLVDKNSNLVKINSGNHRFAISRLLKLKSIPISIKLIHLNSFESDNPNKLISVIENINNFIKNLEKKYQ